MWESAADSSSRAYFCYSCRIALEVVNHAFEAMSSFEKASFILELWEENFEFILDLVKEYVLDVWEERKSSNACAQHPCPPSPTGDLGNIARFKLRNGEDRARKVSLAQ